MSEPCRHCGRLEDSYELAVEQRNHFAARLAAAEKERDELRESHAKLWAERTEIIDRYAAAEKEARQNGDALVRTDDRRLAAEAEIERLKAENASLLESLRESKRFYQDHDDALARQLAAAEQRAEAAEKRNTELEGRLAVWDGHLRDVGSIHACAVRAAAAEQRNTELEGALRDVWPMVERALREDAPYIGKPRPAEHEELTESLRIAREAAIWMRVRTLLKPRAALHDEERSAAPPAQGEEK